MKVTQVAVLLLLFACYCKCAVLFEENFTGTFDPSSATSPWGWYAPMAYKQKGSTIEFKEAVTRKYDAPYPFGISHVSFGAWYIKNLPLLTVGANETIRVTMEVSFKLSGYQNHPFGNAVSNPKSDPRLGTCGFLLKDPISETAFCMFESNKHVWAWHDRFAYPVVSRFNETTGEVTPASYKGFVSWKPYPKRSSGGFDTLTMEYSRKHHTAKWILNGRVIRTTNAPGAYPPTDGVTVVEYASQPNPITSRFDVENLAFMFACVNEPDKVDPFNPGKKGLYNHNAPDSVYELPSKWVSNNANSANDLMYQEFGQTVRFRMRHVKVEKF